MINIKNLSEFKKAMKVGTLVHTIFHMAVGRDEKTQELIIQDKDMGSRAVSISQTNSFALSTPKVDKPNTDSWCYYVKASYYEFNGDIINVYDTDKISGKRWNVLTYKVISIPE